MPNGKRILVTGATGYIGGRLVPELLKAGYDVRVMTRDVRHLQGRSWLDQVDVVQGDVLKAETLPAVVRDIDAAFYLIHSMGAAGDFSERDERAARSFAGAARSAGVDQIVYLGGLGRKTDRLSEHLSSRQQIGDVLREHHPCVTEFRAAMVVGSGSLSFEMVRYLTERIPVMLAPRWLYTRTQPIGIRNVLAYLIAALETPASRGEIIEIGGDDVVNYHDMIHIYAAARGYKRYLIPVPVLTPRLSSYWIHLITPVSASIVRPLIEGLRNETIVTNDKAKALFPDIQPMRFAEAVDAALVKLDAHEVETTWADSMAATWKQDEPYIFVEEHGMLIERRVREVDADPATVYAVFTSLGGDTGWLYLNALWHLRGWLDRIVGGPGYRRGRPPRETLRVGDAVDFWRVEVVEPDSFLLLRAEMKLPGKGWLQFRVTPLDGGRSRLIQTAYFAPRGLFGYAYWYAIFVIHRFIFDGVIDQIVRRAEGQLIRDEARTGRLVGRGALALALMMVGWFVVRLLRSADD